MTKAAIPACRWRGTADAGSFPCASPKLYAPHGVTPETCARCPWPNHAPLTEEEAASRQRQMEEATAAAAAFYKVKRKWQWRKRLAELRLKASRWLRFAHALARHTMAGLPHASTADQAARRAICNPCWRRDKDKDECTLCGCSLAGHSGKKNLLSKIAWAREQCPEFDPVKRPGQYWSAVPGENIWVRLWRWLLRKRG